MVNSISGATTDGGRATPPHEGSYIPHKYTIEDYEEVSCRVVYVGYHTYVHICAHIRTYVCTSML